jgi:DNA-binding PadR family transcriptional regulator
MAERESDATGAQPAMPAEHAILALLAQSDDAASHGYELARQFEAGEPLGNVIHIEPGMIYHHLKKLERLGWVTSSSPTRERTARRSVQLTERGRDELRQWLAAPVTHTREIRLEFLVKLYFALQVDAALASRLVSEQRASCLRFREALLAEDEPDEQHGERKGPFQFSQLVREMRIAQTEAALTWLDRVKRESASG